MIKKVFLVFLLASSLLISTALVSHALPVGWFTSIENGMTVINDTDHNLKWLSPTFTTNVSFFATVGSLVNPFSVFHGFEVADIVDIVGLLESYGVPANPTSSELYSPFLDVLADFGTQASQASVGGFLAGWHDFDPSGPMLPGVFGLMTMDSSSEGGLIVALSILSSPSGPSLSDPNPAFGTWLVATLDPSLGAGPGGSPSPGRMPPRGRIIPDPGGGLPTFGAPVPEPSTIILLGSGLLGLIFFRQKTRKNDA